MLAVRVVELGDLVMGGLVLGLGGKGAWGGAVHLAGVIGAQLNSFTNSFFRSSSS